MNQKIGTIVILAANLVQVKHWLAPSLASNGRYLKTIRDIRNSIMTV